MVNWLKSFWATCQVFAELVKGFKLYADTIEEANEGTPSTGEAKREAVFALLGYSFEVCEHFLVDTPLEGSDIKELAKRVWAVYEAFCAAIGKFKSAMSQG